MNKTTALKMIKKDFSDKPAGWAEAMSNDIEDVDVEATVERSLQVALNSQAPADSEGTCHFTTAEWARRFPAEHVWKLRKPS